MLSLVLALDLFASEKKQFFGELYLGASSLGDRSFSQTNFAPAGVNANMDTDLGYRIGGSIGYYLQDNLSIDLTFDYITNQANSRLSNGQVFNEGDYSSRVHFLNINYYFNEWKQGIKPFIGLGIGIIQEIDIDFEDNTGEQSFSDSGGIGYQFSLGIEYQVTPKWIAGIELNKISFSSPDFESENTSAEITDNDSYDPWTLNFTAKYLF